MALAGAIGTGLFLGSGKSIAHAGPGEFASQVHRPVGFVPDGKLSISRSFAFVYHYRIRRLVYDVLPGRDDCEYGYPREGVA